MKETSGVVLPPVLDRLSLSLSSEAAMMGRENRLPSMSRVGTAGVHFEATDVWVDSEYTDRCVCVCDEVRVWRCGDGGEGWCEDGEVRVLWGDGEVRVVWR